MSWYGWLILGVLITIIAILVFIIIRREPLVIRGLTDEEKNLLDKIERDRGKKIAEYDAFRLARLEEVAKKQKNDLVNIEKAYHESKNFISKQKQAEFESYLKDADRAGAELDKLLSTSRREDTTRSS